MRQFKFISVILLFLLAFISRAESYKYPSELLVLRSQDKSISSKAPFIPSSALTQAKDLDIHFTVKKKIKYRATTSESTILRTPHLTKLVNFKIFKNRLIYGIASIYQIQRHTYLHLYQLF